MTSPPYAHTARNIARTLSIILRCRVCLTCRVFTPRSFLELKSFALDQLVHSGANITNNGIYVSNATMMAQNVTSSRISNGSFASVSTGGSVTIPMSSASAFMSPRGPSNTEKKSANLSPKSTSYIFASGLFSRFAARRSVQIDNRMGSTGEISRCPVFISNSGSVVSLKNTASACALTCAFSSAFRLLPMILKRVLIPSRYPSPFILL